VTSRAAGNPLLHVGACVIAGAVSVMRISARKRPSCASLFGNSGIA
jgi:hypothetical protein